MERNNGRIGHKHSEETKRKKMSLNDFQIILKGGSKDV